jgi:hypothetical protein
VGVVFISKCYFAILSTATGKVKDKKYYILYERKSYKFISFHADFYLLTVRNFLDVSAEFNTD